MGDNHEDLVAVSPPVDWLAKIAPLLDTFVGSPSVCRCAPGLASLDGADEEGRVFCDDCGLLMLATTIGELVRRHQEQAKCSA